MNATALRVRVATILSTAKNVDRKLVEKDCQKDIVNSTNYIKKCRLLICELSFQ